MSEATNELMYELLKRIEIRLELRELAEPFTPYEPK